jgi:hypothetical protein
MRFKEFLIHLEQDAGATPTSGLGDGGSSGSGDAGSSGETHNDVKSHTAFQMKMSPEEFEDAESSNLVMDYLPYDFTKEWGFAVNGPVALEKEPISKDLYKVKFMLSQKSPVDFYIPPDIVYKGKIEDKTVYMSDGDIEKIRGQWSPQGGSLPPAQPPTGGMPGGMGGGMGGMPGMPGGM